MSYLSIRLPFLIALLIIPLATYLLGRYQTFLKVILYIIVTYLLIYKIGEYYYHLVVEKNNQFPVEFSAISYFLVALGLYLHLQGLRNFSAYLSLLSGFFYGVANIVNPASFLNNPTYYLIMARINHILLYLVGFLVLTCYFNNGKRYYYYLGIVLVIGYAYIMKYYFNYSDTSYLIYELTLGTFLRDLSWFSPYLYVVYYILLIIAYILSVKIYLKLSDTYYYALY